MTPRRIIGGLLLAGGLSGGWLATQSASGPRSEPEIATVIVRPSETVETAMVRGGAGREDADAAGRLLFGLGKDALPAGTPLRLVLARPEHDGPRLMRVSLRAPAGESVDLVRTYDGRFRPEGGSADGREVVTVADETVRGSIVETAARAGADPALIRTATALLAGRLDFARDIRQGDRLRLVFKRRVTAGGDTIQTGELLYAGVVTDAGDAGLYAFNHDVRTDYLDAAGQSGQGLLLRTPVMGAQVSSPFGMRRHPILGFSRMHQGVDFAAPLGTPVLAAGDGAIVEAKVWGGYGNWLRIRHAGGWETGYAHLASFAPGLTPGSSVRKGQVIGYVGDTGLATGPHLHFELWRQGVRIDPALSPQAPAPGLDPSAAEDFAIQRERIDGFIIAAAPEAGGHIVRLSQAGAIPRPAASSPSGLRSSRL